MFIRFQGAILLAVLTSIASTRMECAALDQRRLLSAQHYEVDALRERVARLRLQVEQRGNLATLIQPHEEGRLYRPENHRSARSDVPTTPLLRWRATGAGEW